MLGDLLLKIKCPKCSSSFVEKESELPCKQCSSRFSVEFGIPLLFYHGDENNITYKIKDFYESNPFPNYDDFDSIISLREKSRKSIFAKMLDDEIPYGANIIEIGCGTGQMSIFLSLANRNVIATDVSLNSLKLGKTFSEKHRLENSSFFQMNLFNPIFDEAMFDIVLSNGVLHHTIDSRKAFSSIAKLLKKGGYIIIGLYHKYGRLTNDIRKFLIKYSNKRLNFLDERMRDSTINEIRKEAWFADQYKNPYESKHTISEVIRWFEQEDITFIRSLPSTKLFDVFDEKETLFSKIEPAGTIERYITEILMSVTHSKEGGFFVAIGRKK